MSKNECGKTRKVDNPYEIWANSNAGWEWRILKKYQTPENEAKNEFARWFCAVKSPMTYGGWEYGDTYIKDIKDVAVKREVTLGDLIYEEKWYAKGGSVKEYYVSFDVGSEDWGTNIEAENKSEAEKKAIELFREQNPNSSSYDVENIKVED